MKAKDYLIGAIQLLGIYLIALALTLIVLAVPILTFVKLLKSVY